MSEAARARFIEPMQNDAGTWGVDIGGHWLPCDGESEEEVRATAQRVAQRIDAYAAEQTADRDRQIAAQDASIETLRDELDRMAEQTAGLRAALSKWRVWERGGHFMIGHAIDGDGPTREEWQELGALLADSGQAVEEDALATAWNKNKEMLWTAVEYAKGLGEAAWKAVEAAAVEKARGR